MDVLGIPESHFVPWCAAAGVTFAVLHRSPPLSAAAAVPSGLSPWLPPAALPLLLPLPLRARAVPRATRPLPRSVLLLCLCLVAVAALRRAALVPRPSVWSVHLAMHRPQLPLPLPLARPRLPLSLLLARLRPRLLLRPSRLHRTPSRANTRALVHALVRPPIRPHRLPTLRR